MFRIWQAIASVWTWLVLITCTIVWLPLMLIVRLVTAPFDPGLYAAGYLFRKIATVVERLNPLWHFGVSGTFPADPRRPYIVVSNHESFADILLISLLPWEMKWLSKAEMFRLPVFGWLMWLAGDIPVSRGSARSAVEAMARCRDVLGRRVSVMIFPEGTRSTTGEMLPFRDGPFRLAVDTGLPILPLAVHGTGAALPKNGWRFGRSRAMVRVLAPVETTGLTVRDVPALKQQIRDTILGASDAIAAEMKKDVTRG